MTVTTRRERREQQRRREQRRSGRARSGVSQVWIAVGVAVAIVALILVARQLGVFDAPAGATVDVQSIDKSGPTLGEHKESLGQEHIPTAQKGSYPSLPP